MTDYDLATFTGECRDRIADCASPADCVERLVPAMYRLLNGSRSFLRPEHFRADPDHYARNAVHVDDNGLMGLYALVWLPGQWTPVHDHGTWGVVGVLEGALEEHNFMRTDSQPESAMTHIELARGGVILLVSGAVTSFVPNPDHIHRTGNGSVDRRVVSLHLYGHAMAGFHVYDLQAQTREWTEVSHNES